MPLPLPGVARVEVMAREKRRDDIGRIISGIVLESGCVQEEQLFLSAVKCNDKAAGLSYSPPESIVPWPTSSYHHIADVLLRGYNK